MGKPLVMRLNLNQQSSGDAWFWHKNLIDSLIPIVDCGVHYVDVMCQLTGAKPVRVHGIGAALWAEADKQNYGHLHVTFDDGSVGWYEAGWGPMMSETAFFVKDIVGPKGSVSLVPDDHARAGEEDLSDSANIDKHTKTDVIRVHHAAVGADKHFLKKDEILRMADEPGHQELCDREQAYFLRAIREDESAAASLGKRPFVFRLQSFVIGSMLMGLGGAVYAHFVGYIAPEDFLPILTFQLWAMLIVGGSGNNRGAVIGAFVVWTFWAAAGGLLRGWVPQAEQARAAALQVVLIGVLIALMLVLRPRGLIGEEVTVSRND